MFKYFKQLPLILSSLLFISSCSPMEIFTNFTKAKFSLTNEDLKYVQYYLTTTVTLNRMQMTRSAGVEKDKNSLTSTSNILMQQIVIDEATQGAALNVEDNKLSVLFDKDLSFTFEPKNYDNDTPYILTEINNRQIFQSGDTVFYSGKSYIASFKNLPGLKYKFDSSLNEKLEQTKAKGVTVKEMIELQKKKK